MFDKRKAGALIAVGTAALTFLMFKALNLVPLLPPQAALEAAIIDEAFDHMLAITVPIFAFVVAILIYSVAAFRAKSEGEQGERFDHSHGYMIELSWISLSIVLTLGLAAYGTEEFLELRGDRRADIDVQVKAAQWSWEFYYPAEKNYRPELLLPKGKRARILLTSEDVVHAFWVPAFRVKQDALPGRVVEVYVTPTKTGEYELVCAELCGLDHTVMRSKVRVVEPEEFAKAGQSEW